MAGMFKARLIENLFGDGIGNKPVCVSAKAHLYGCFDAACNSRRIGAIWLSCAGRAARDRDDRQDVWEGLGGLADLVYNGYAICRKQVRRGKDSKAMLRLTAQSLPCLHCDFRANPAGVAHGYDKRAGGHFGRSALADDEGRFAANITQ